MDILKKVKKVEDEIDEKFFKKFDNKIVNNKSIIGQPKVAGYLINGKNLKDIHINIENDCAMQVLRLHSNYLQYICSQNEIESTLSPIQQAKMNKIENSTIL